MKGRNPAFGGRIYRGIDFLHRPVDIPDASSTVYPDAKMRTAQGFWGLFHSVHTVYSYCYLYHIYINYVCFGLRCIPQRSAAFTAKTLH